MGADCLATWLEDHNTCPMCRTPLFEKPAISFPVPGPRVVAAMGALSDELLGRVPLAGALVGEDSGEGGGGGGALLGSESREGVGDANGDGDALPGTDSPEHAVEANVDDGAVPGIDLSQVATGDETRRGAGRGATATATDCRPGFGVGTGTPRWEGGVSGAVTGTGE